MNCTGAELVVILRLQRKDEAKEISRSESKKFETETQADEPKPL